MQRRKFVIGMGALASGAAASVGTGAFTAMQADGREANINVVNDESALIGLKAGDTDLVTGTSDGQLAINFNLDDAGDGVNPNSTYQVGGLGGFDTGNLQYLPGDPTASPNVESVAIDTQTPIIDEHAFMVMNQSGAEQQIEVAYEANEEFPDDAQVYLVAFYPEGSGTSSQEEGLAVGDVTGENPKSASIIYADQQYSDPIGAGNSFYVTIIVNVGDADPGTDLGGQITVRAGSHDDFTNADA
ncbi:hypothetical protein [Natronomonas salsuginis]|uniref:hypothetical protein n=1 Tax=Natronomonas salsuginis TaxID=2217661 RepID=UPI001C9E4BEB|nr:hypothetical protein [Natronomonas salsuginis]